MSGWIFCSDLHLDNHRAWGGEMVGGLNDRARRTLAVVGEVAAVAKRHNCTRVAILGDVFNCANPTPQLVAALAAEMRRWTCEWHLLVGNHDMVSEDPGDHALAPLAHVPGVYVHERDTVVDGVLFAPYRRAKVSDWLDDVLARHADEAGVLCAHFGLILSDTAHFLGGAHDAAPAQWLNARLHDRGYRQAFLGNWHEERCSGRVYQLGTICPHSFSDRALGAVARWRNGGTEILKEDLPSAPVFITWDAVEQAPENFDARNLRFPFYLRVRNVPRAQAEDLRREFSQRVSFDRLLGVELEVVPEERERKVATIGSFGDRELLARRYVERTFKGETKEARNMLLKMMRDYGALK